MNAPHLARDIGVTLVALVFTFWALAGTGYQVAYYGIFVFFLGIPVYIWMKAQRGEFGESPVIPIDYPADSPYGTRPNRPTTKSVYTNGTVNGAAAVATADRTTIREALP